LKNKIEKSIIDLFLVGEFDKIISRYCSVENIEELNGLEFCLLIAVLINRGKENEA